MILGVCLTKKTFLADFFIIKPTRCTNLPNILQHETLHVSGSSSAHHQEFIHCTLSNGILSHTGTVHTAVEQDQDGTEFYPGPARKLSSNLYDMYQCQVYSELTPDNVQRNCPKYVQVHFLAKINLGN
jgi:hypothetical protein